MTYFISDIIGSEILLYNEGARLGPILDLIFAPEDGSVAGFVCFDPIAGKKKVFVPGSVRRMEGKRVLIDGHDSLSDISDLIRVKEAQKLGAKIIGEQVITRSGQKLGRVTTAAVDVVHWRLSRLYVNSALSLKFLTRELIIPAKKIEKIEKKRIYVSNQESELRAAKPQTAKLVD